MFWQILSTSLRPREDLPILRFKRSAFEIEDLPGLWRIHWHWQNDILISTFYTRIDQACLLWGVLSAIIFLTAQFSTWTWQLQAMLWSGLTVLGIALTAQLVQPWRTTSALLNRTLHVWTGLMLAGLIITDLSIFLNWGQGLARLCELWLVIDALGYFYSGLQLQSRAFGLVGVVHLLGVALLPHVGMWQLLTTGLLSTIGALLLAILQWDSGDDCAHLRTTKIPDRVSDLWIYDSESLTKFNPSNPSPQI